MAKSKYRPPPARIWIPKEPRGPIPYNIESSRVTPIAMRIAAANVREKDNISSSRLNLISPPAIDNVIRLLIQVTVVMPITMPSTPREANDDAC